MGEYISGKLKSAAWGDGVVAELARFLARTQPSLRGFTRASLFRMRQFFDAYNGDAIVAALLRQLPWTVSARKNESFTFAWPAVNAGQVASYGAKLNVGCLNAP